MSGPGNTGNDQPGSNSPGSAAPRCGTCNTLSIRSGLRKNGDDTGDCRSGERRSQHSQENRGWNSRGYLPHFDSPRVIQHITYRLADSLPRVALEKIQAETKSLALSDEKRQTELRRRIETYLDAGYGCCVLREPEVAACIVDTWNRFDGERYRLLEWVVMPNHCHVLIEPFEGVALGKIVLSWKNYTARFINAHRGRGGCVDAGRTGVRRSQGDPQKSSQVWQREYWDRFIRDAGHFESVRSYIALNPVKAALVAQPEDWPWGSARVRCEYDAKR